MQRVRMTAFFDFEVRRFFSRAVVIGLAAYFCLVLYVVNSGIDDYRDVLANIRESREVEARMFREIRNYTHYSFHGVRVFYVPSPAGILMAPLEQIAGRVDSVVTLDIYRDSKGKCMPGLKTAGPAVFNFHFLVSVIGALLPLFMGFEAVFYREYLKFLSSAAHYGRIFAAIFLSRLFIIFILLAICFSWGLVFMALRGVDLAFTDYAGIAGYFFATLLMMTAFLAGGILAGSLRPLKLRAGVLLAAWLVFALLIPQAVHVIAGKLKAKLPSNSAVKLEKLNIVNTFEERSAQEQGDFDRKKIEKERELIDSYWNNDFQKLESLELELQGKIREITAAINRLAVITPASFCSLTAFEVSSYGFANYITWHGRLIRLNRDFVRFFIDRCFYNDPSVLVSFVKGDGNLYRADCRLPGNYAAGAGVQLVYIFLLLAAARLRFKQLLFQEQGEETVPGSINNIRIKKGDFKVFFMKRTAIARELFNFLAGRMKPAGQREIASRLPLDIFRPGETRGTAAADFIYLCKPSAFPGNTRVRDFLVFAARFFRLPGSVKRQLLNDAAARKITGKYFNRLRDLEKGRVILSIISRIQCPLYLLDDIACAMPVEFCFDINRLFTGLAQSGAAVVLLVSTPVISDNRFATDGDLTEIKEWSRLVSIIQSIPGSF